jgi:hypothetical protein
MAIVQGIRERLHLPIYDCVTVEPEKQLRDAEPSSTMRFFVNVQNKTKLETNLQSASLLPHYNTFEARSMRVVLSDLPPKFPNEPEAEDDEYEVTVVRNGDDVPISISAANVVSAQGEAGFDPARQVMASLTLPLDRVVELLREAAKPENEGSTTISFDTDESAIELSLLGDPNAAVDEDAVSNAGGEIIVTEGDLKAMLEDLQNERKIPLEEQVRADGGSTSIMNRLLYGSVTTLYVGEKIMMQMPTWYFPSGAGTYSSAGKSVTHGLPSPTDTFRFAEPIFIERQQNFRVEIEIPDSDTLKDLQRIYGPFFIWVVLDGYMTRGVQ